MAKGKPVSKKKAESINKDLTEAELKRLGGSLDTGITTIIREVAVKHKVTESTVRNRYYSTVKDKVSIENTANTDEESEDITSTNYVAVPYKSGDLIEVVVAKILDKIGAICTTTDDLNLQGMVHISRIAETYITSVRDYFTEGEVLKVEFQGTNNRGELELSTVGIKTSEPVPPAQEKNSLYSTLNVIKNQLEQDSNNDSEQLALLRKITNEEEKILRYLNGVVGVVTPAAREELFNVIEEHGIFAFTLKMNELAQKFVNDLGLIFIRQVQNSLKDESL